MSDRSYRPRAREDGLLVEPLGDELLVFDSERGRAHSLNDTAAKVWRECDGERDIDALQVACELDEDTLQLALERLRSSHLLDEPEGADRVSRRVMLRRSALTGAGIGVALPVIRSITAPSPAMAASMGACVQKSKTGCFTTPCCPGLVCNVNSSCVSTCTSTGPCTLNAQCCRHHVCSGGHCKYCSLCG